MTILCVFKLFAGFSGLRNVSSLLLLQVKNLVSMKHACHESKLLSFIHFGKCTNDTSLGILRDQLKSRNLIRGELLKTLRVGQRLRKLAMRYVGEAELNPSSMTKISSWNDMISPHSTMLEYISERALEVGNAS